MVQRNLFNLFGGGNSPAASVGKVAIGATRVTGTVPAGATAVCRKKVGSTITTLGDATVSATGVATYNLSAPATGTESYGFVWTLAGDSGFTAVIVGLGPAALAFTAGAAAGSFIAAATGLPAGVKLKSVSPNDGRLAINAAGDTFVVGLTSSSTGTVSYTVTLTNGDTFPITVTVGAAPTTPDGSAANPNRMMYGSTRSGLPGVRTAPASGQECRVNKIRFYTPDYPVQKMQPVLVNFGMDRTGVVSPEIATGNPITIYKIALLIGSTYYQLPFSGTIEDGATLVVPAYTLPAALPPRTECFWIIGDSCAPGQYSAGGFVRQSTNNGEIVTRAASFTDGWFDGSVAIPNNTNIANPGGGQLYAPVQTLMDRWDGRAVVGIEGDSVIEAANDFGVFAGASGVTGWGARGCDSNDNGQLRLPHANFAVSGSRPSGMSSRDVGKFQLRGAMHDAMRAVNAALGIMGSDGKGATPFTRILSGHIGNDASGGLSASALQTVMDNYWAFLAAEFPDCGIVQTGAYTANYSTTSANTDPAQWTTYEGQAPRTIDTTPNTGARWIVSDGYLNNKPAVLADTIDQSAFHMDASQRKWLTRAFTATLQADYTGGLTISLSAAPQIGEALVVGAGTSSASKPQLVTAVSGSGPYTVTLFAGLVQPGSSSTVATQTAGAPVKAASTNDGLHASPIVHREMAVAVVAAKAAGKFPSFAAPTPTPTVDPAPLSLANLPSALRAIIPGSGAYEQGAHLTGRRKVGRLSTATLKDLATATLPTGWTRDNTNKWVNLTSSIPSDQTTISDWLLQDDWTFRIPASGGTPLDLTFSNNVIKPAKTKICAIDNRQNGNYTLVNNDIGGSVEEAAGCKQTFVMHPGGLGSHTYKDNAFWNKPEDHIRLSEGGGTIQGNFFFGGGLNQAADPHFDCIQVLPNQVPRTLKGNILIKDNCFDMRRGIGQVQAIRLADIVAIDAGVTITITGNVSADPNFDISFPQINWPVVVTGNYMYAQPFPAYYKDGAADFGEYLNPVPSQAIIYDNYRGETGAKLTFEQNRPSNAAVTLPASSSVFSAGTWNDVATWSDTDMWVD